MDGPLRNFQAIGANLVHIVCLCFVDIFFVNTVLLEVYTSIGGTSKSYQLLILTIKQA